MRYYYGLIVTLLVIVNIAAASAGSPGYLWLKGTSSRSIASDIAPPKGYVRTKLKQSSWAYWLRHLPLKKPGTEVFLYDGRKKSNQDAHVEVINIDVGTRDLQQCADAIIRLKSEYLYARRAYSSIHFNFTSGHEATFPKWARGYRPVVKGNSVKWVKKRSKDYSYANFRRYLRTVFMYAGTYSLSKELKHRPSVKEMRIGDIFIKGGFPGHSVLVVDMAHNPGTGKKVFLLAQSYMPAQDIHVLRNPSDRSLSPWYELDFGKTLGTPEWNFGRTGLMHFR